LITEGWPDWNKKDFFNFIKMAEQHGRKPTTFDLYREALPYKSADQIEAYSAAFWQKNQVIENH